MVDINKLVKELNFKNANIRYSSLGIETEYVERGYKKGNEVSNSLHLPAISSIIHTDSGAMIVIEDEKYGIDTYYDEPTSEEKRILEETFGLKYDESLNR